MRILQVNPIEVKSFTRCCNNIKRDSILVGNRGDDNYYVSDLIFDPFLSNQNEVVIKAVLKMYCKTADSYCGMNIYINNTDIHLPVYGIGSYEWDVTRIVKKEGVHNLELCIYTKDKICGCSIKQFETLNSNMKPVLELTLYGAQNHVDFVEDYTSTNSIQYSHWIDCSCLNKYYYFIENLGNSQVEIFIEISPNKFLVYQDSGPFRIKANGVSYLQPMRESRFVRIIYKNLLLNEANLIKVWFQGKK